MVHVLLLLAHACAIGFLVGVLARMVRDTWREQTECLITSWVEGPALDAVEKGYMTFIPIEVIRTTMPMPRGIQ